MSEYLSIQCWICRYHKKVRVGEVGDEGRIYFTSACGYGKSFGVKECALFEKQESVEESNE